jgi:alkylation response protein AidB-like acyl-CoA dehydrogenase
VRKQFGHPIGRFQGVKHPLAEIYVAVESARSLTYYASWALDNLPDAARYVSMAKAYASEALDRAGEECIQIHGAIGFTWECDAHLFYKRGRYCRNLLGSPEYHRERVLASQGL